MSGTKYSLKFDGEIKQVSSKKTASLDIVYRVVLDTPDPAVMALGQLAPDQLFDITVESQE